MDLSWALTGSVAMLLLGSAIAPVRSAIIGDLAARNLHLQGTVEELLRLKVVLRRRPHHLDEDRKLGESWRSRRRARARGSI